MTARRRNRIRRLTQLAADQQREFAGAKERLFALVETRLARMTDTERAAIMALRAANAALPAAVRAQQVQDLIATMRARDGH